MTAAPVLYTAAQVAADLGVAPSRVRQLAASMQVGQRVGGAGWVFTAGDVERMRQRPLPGWRKGRPRKGSNESAE